MLVPKVGRIMQSPAELGLLHHYLRSASTYFEFGMGASTAHVAQHFGSLEHIHAVELDGTPLFVTYLKLDLGLRHFHIW